MSTEEDDLYDDDIPESGGIAAVLLPFATAIASLVLGVVVGLLLGFLLKPAQQVEIQVPRELTQAELEAACAPAVAEKAKDLEQAQEKVTMLATEVTTKEAKVAELEAEMTKRSERGRALVLELERAKKELVEVKAALVIAEEEKAQLVEELTFTEAKLEETEEALVEQIELTDLAKEDALTNKWYRFINDAQLEICEKGNRKKLGRCREGVQDHLMDGAIRDKFAHCVRSAQATPTVLLMEKGEIMPQFAHYIDQEDKITKDWYILLCDPTLPEAEGFLNEEHLPATDGSELDDLE